VSVTSSSARPAIFGTVAMIPTCAHVPIPIRRQTTVPRFRAHQHRAPFRSCGGSGGGTGILAPTAPPLPRYSAPSEISASCSWPVITSPVSGGALAASLPRSYASRLPLLHRLAQQVQQPHPLLRPPRCAARPLSASSFRRSASPPAAALVLGLRLLSPSATSLCGVLARSLALLGALITP
jgi:hypothetical protein